MGVQVGPVTVVAPPALRARAMALAERVDEPMEFPGLGRHVPEPFVLVLAEDSLALARLSRGRAPGWGAAVAFPRSRTIMLRADLPNLEQTLRHELAHLALRSAVRSYLPLWFDEGYATLAAGELGGMIQLELNLAVSLSRVPTLRQLDGLLRGSATDASTAYALAATAVAELMRRPAPGDLSALMDRLEAGEPFALALEAALGLSEERFETLWRRSLRRRYGVITWLAAGGFWTIVALSVFVVTWHKRERDQPRRAALDLDWNLPALPSEGGGAIPANEPVDPGDEGG
ncbi:MAG: hypothetical protein E4H17_00695 [Gemmatimonadales bacterium]|nr:MAG: hypothetical protein E4H17_00695 [Gemmatimonadales bacterium]